MIKVFFVVLLGVSYGALQSGHNKSIDPATAGTVANIEDYPSVVALINRDDWSSFCGGIIINSEWILTAASCFLGVENTNFQNMVILAGSTYLSSGGTWHSVVEGRKTDNFGSFGGYGVGIMKVSPNFYFGGKKIKPAILPLQGDIPLPGEYATIVAHGGIMDPSMHQSDELRKVVFEIIDKIECQNSYIGKNLTVSDYHFCTKGPTSEDDRLCLYNRGDVTFKDGVVIGLRMWDQNCSGASNVYIRLSAYVKWILENVL